MENTLPRTMRFGDGSSIRIHEEGVTASWNPVPIEEFEKVSMAQTVLEDIMARHALAVESRRSIAATEI